MANGDARRMPADLRYSRASFIPSPLTVKT